MTEELKACREEFEKFDIGAYPPYDHRKDDNGNYVISGRQRMWKMWQAAWNTRTPPTEESIAKDQLWQMAYIQDKPEDHSAFMANWLRGTIKIPQCVKDRIYWSEHEARKTPVPVDTINIKKDVLMVTIEGLRAIRMNYSGKEPIAADIASGRLASLDAVLSEGK